MFSYKLFTFPFPIFVILELLFSTLPYLIYKRKTNQSRVKRRDNTALIIPCHKAEKVISKTIESALKIFDASSIFVIDNGNNPKSEDQTYAICLEYGVNYKYVPIGNKTVAMYVGVQLAKQFEYVLQIDDDMCLSEDMSFPISDTTHCIAYTISATNLNGEEKLIHKFQDLEYKMSGIMKAFESYVASATFPHGAISLWKRTTFLEILEQHPMYPLSDDWFTGFICNSLGYRIETCDTIFIKTDVPSVYISANKDTRETGYGGVSLFCQRFTRWYRFTLVQVWYMLCIFFTNWKLPLIRAFMLKVIWTWRILTITLILSKYIFLGLTMWTNPVWGSYMLILILMCSQISMILFTYRQLEKHERQPINVMILFSLYRMYDSLCFMISIYASIILMIPTLWFSKRINIKENKIINVLLNSKNTQS
jgi:glycosyltransferase involved in cell wall biosynthesis